MEDLSLERVAWRRKNVSHHYAGSLSATDGSIRLVGEDPATGIAVSLSIPFAEIERIRVSASPDEDVVGHRCVVLELVDAQAICLAQTGSGHRPPRWLARRLAGLVESDSPGRAHGGNGNRR